MVQRLCLVSLILSNRKTSYRSLKQTAGSTSCPWTTILVFWLKCPFSAMPIRCSYDVSRGLGFCFLNLCCLLTKENRRGYCAFRSVQKNPTAAAKMELGAVSGLRRLLMKLNEYQRSRSFYDHSQKSLRFQSYNLCSSETKGYLKPNFV